MLHQSKCKIFFFFCYTKVNVRYFRYTKVNVKYFVLHQNKCKKALYGFTHIKTAECNLSILMYIFFAERS